MLGRWQPETQNLRLHNVITNTASITENPAVFDSVVFTPRWGDPSTADDKEKGSTHSFHFQHIAHRGACGKTRVVPQNRPPVLRPGGTPRPKAEPAEMGVAKCVCFLLST